MRNVLLLVLVVVIGVFAFKPNDIGHAGITEQALADLGFTATARESVANANILTDIFEQFTHAAHFDDEYIAQGSQRLLDKKAEIYAVFEKIAQKIDGVSLSATPSSDFLDFFDFLEDSTSNIIDSVGKLFGLNSDSDISEAWTLLGQALHGLQDFYSHSNWVEMGNQFPNTVLGKAVIPTPTNTRPCPVDPAVLDLEGDGGDKLTTSYFDFDPSKHCDLHSTRPGKCRHGWDFAGCPTGLNKDEPTRPNFDIAKAIAIESTKNYVQLIIDSIDDLPFQNDKVLSLFLGGAEYDDTTDPIISSQFLSNKELASDCGSSTFTIDNTGSDYFVIVSSKNYDSITLTNPSSTEVSDNDDSDDDRKVFDLGDNPAVGVWTVNVCSSDNNKVEFSVDVEMQSSYYLQDFAFMRVLDPRTSFLFPLSPITDPIFGNSESFVAVVFGDVSDESIKFEVVDVTGENVLGTLDSVLVSTFSDSAKFSAQNNGISLPSQQPFRIRITGKTADTNEDLVRYNSRVYTAQTVGVQFNDPIASFIYGPDMVSSNEGVTFNFEVTNYNVDDAQYTLKAVINSTSSASFKVSIESVSSGTVIQEKFLPPAHRLEARGAHGSHGIRARQNIESITRRDVDSGSRTVTIGGRQTVSVKVTVVLESKEDIEHGEILKLSLTATGSDSVNADIVFGQFLDCPGSPVCSGQGICVASDTCACEAGFGGSSCSGESSSGFLSGIFSSSPTPGSPATPAASTNVSPASNSNASPLTISNVSPASNSNISPLTISNVSPVSISNVSPVSISNASPASNSNASPVSNSNASPVSNSNASPVSNSNGNNSSPASVLSASIAILFGLLAVLLI